MTSYCHAGAFALLLWLPAVHQVEIKSNWSGIVARPGTHLLIAKSGSAYYRDGESVDGNLIDALVKALRAAVNPKPNLEDLGITPAWLAANASSVARKEEATTINGQPIHLAALEKMFADPAAMEKIAPKLITERHTDDYPWVNVDVTFEDGSSLSAWTRSQSPFLLPWNVNDEGGRVVAYNADISRATAALMPEKAMNRSRLSGENLDVLLANLAIFQIEHEQSMLDLEGKTGDTFRLLRSKYTVESAEIRLSRAPSENEGENLYLSLKADYLPKNFSHEVVLRYDDGKVFGADKFMRDGPQMEKFVLSIPWISRFIEEHPKVTFRLSYDQTSSFSDQQIKLFSADMRAIGQDALIAEVEGMKGRIALLSANLNSDWLIRPDKRVILWRYASYSGAPERIKTYLLGNATLFQWPVSDFPTKPCSDHIAFRGCVGKEILASGDLR